MNQKLLSQQQIENCRQGKAEGFNWILSTYGKRLYGYFLRHSSSPAEAEDLLQELFVRLMEKMSTYREQGRFENWLFRVAANLARDRARRRRHEPRAFSQYGGEDDDSRLDGDVAGDGPAVGEALEQQEQVKMMQQALSQLPELDREIILMRHYGEMSFRELAKHFQIPVGTALAKVHRGLKRLRTLMEERRS